LCCASFFAFMTGEIEDWEKEWNEEALVASLETLQVSPTTQAKARAVKGRGAVKYTDDETKDLGIEKQSSRNLLGAETDHSIKEGGSYNTIDSNNHILELYDFSSSVKTSDLDNFLEPFKSLGYRIKWIDDSHALAIFRSAAFAENALKTLHHPIIKIRPLNQASKQAKEFIRGGGGGGGGKDWRIPPPVSGDTPPRNNSVRPATSTVVAKRLIGNILQIPELQRAKDPSPQKKTNDSKKDTKENNYWEN